MAMRLGEKIGYGLGDTASSMLWKLFSVYLMFFYTDISGIDAMGGRRPVFSDADLGFTARSRRRAFCVTAHTAVGEPFGRGCCGVPCLSGYWAS